MSARGAPATCVRLAAEAKGAEPHSPGVSRAFSHPSLSEGEGNTLLDQTWKMSTSRASCSEFLEKARAPMATEEFERILRTEREYWSASCLEEVKALQKAVTAVQQQASSDRAEAEAMRASMRDLRAEAECFSAAGAAKMAVLEATVAELHGALQAEREQRGDELRQAEERHRAELAAVRAAHEGALGALRREGDAGHVDRMLASLQSDVARLQAAADDRLEEPLQRLCQLSEGLEQTRGSVDAAHQRISELELGQAQARERISCLDDTQAQALAAQGSLREAFADGTRQSWGDTQQTQEALRELRAEVNRLAEAAREQEEAGAVGESNGGAGVGSGVLIGSLQRLVQDQRRELSVLSSDLGRLRELHESEADRSRQALGAMRTFLEEACEEKLRRAGELEDAASTKAASRQHQWLAVCERVAEIESRLGAPAAQPQQEALPTLLTNAARASATAAEGAKPGANDAEAGAVPVGLKDSLHGVVAAVQKVLQDSGAPSGPAAASGPPGVPASPRPVQRLARPLSAAPAPAWRAQTQQRLVAPAVAKPLVQASPGPVLAIGQRSHGGSAAARAGSIQIAPGTPLLVRR